MWAIFLINFLIRSYNKKPEVSYWKKYKVYFVKYSHVFLSTWKLVFSAFSNSNVVTWADNFWDVLVWFFLFQKNRSTYKNFLNLILSYFKQLHVIVLEKELEQSILFHKTFRFSTHWIGLLTICLYVFKGYHRKYILP